MLDGYGDYGVEVTGYPAGWSVAAARAAITAGTPLLLPLLDDEPGLLRCVRRMLHPEEPEPYSDDPWAPSPE